MKASIYTRPEKPLTIPVKKRTGLPIKKTISKPAEPLQIHSTSQCFVTPLPVAQRLVDYADIEDGHLVYEPSAGTGNIVQTLLDRDESMTITANDINSVLVEHLRKRFSVNDITITQHDFLEDKQLYIDRIVMNPPFGRNQAKKHIQKAFDCLADDGVITAIVPVTLEFEGSEILEYLPDDTFTGTKVNTKIIRIEK